GMLQANEVIKMILEIGEVLSGKILVYNVLNNEQQKYDFEKNAIAKLDKKTFEEKYKVTENQVEEIAASAIFDEIDNDEVLFLDVRNEGELPKINFKNGIQIPLMNLESEIENLNPNQTIYVYCQSGIRSKIAVELLQKKNYRNVKSIVGGALALSQIFKEEKIKV
ncbi:MAG: rhodanese-like domain-containing protein, partial [Flavobacterium sp.]